MLFYDAKTMLEKIAQCSPALLFGRGPNRVIEMTHKVAIGTQYVLT